MKWCIQIFRFSWIVILSSSFFVSSLAFSASEVKKINKQVVKEKTILIYLSGDNNLSELIAKTFDQILQTGGSTQNNVLVMFDGNKKNDSKLVLLSSTGSRHQILKQNVEFNMGSPQTLAQFIELGKKQYPAQETILYIFAHGRGILNIPVQDGSKFGQDDFLRLASSSDDSSGTYFDETELVQSLQQTLKNEKLDLLVLNSCLMGNLEVLNVLAPIAKYAMASEYTICVDAKGTSELRERHRGISAKMLLKTANENPGISVLSLSQSVISEFESAYKDFMIPTDTETPERCPSTVALFDLQKISDVGSALANIEKNFLARHATDLALNTKLIENTMSATYVDDFGYLDLNTLVSLLGQDDSQLQKALHELIKFKVDLYAETGQPISHLSVFFPPTGTDRQTFEKFYQHYQAIPAIQPFGFEKLLRHVRSFYEAHKFQMIRGWVLQTLEGKEVLLRPGASKEYNEYYVFLMAELALMEYKSKNMTSDIQSYLQLIVESKYQSEGFTRHKSEVDKILGN